MTSTVITAVEGDTQFPVLLALADAYAYFPLSTASSVTLRMNGLSTTLTPSPSVGYAGTTLPATFTATPGHFHAHVLVTVDGSDHYFPSESPLFVEILPHTRARS